MMIFWRARLAFLAMPKTGTHAYQDALRDSADIIIRNPTGAKHMNARKFHRHMRPILGKKESASLETLAVIREPVDWLGSWYRYRSRPQLTGHPNSTADVSFDSFVRAYLSDEPPAYARLGSPYRFISDDGGEVLVDHLFNFADLEPLNAFLADRLERPVVTSKRNVSPSRDLVLAKETLALLQAERSEDFSIYQTVTRRN